MPLRVVCQHCGHEYPAEQGATRTPCPKCQDDETSEWEIPPELRAEEWQDPDIVEE